MNFTANPMLFWRGILFPRNPGVIWKSQGYLRPPLLFQWFLTCAFTVDSLTRSARGIPLGHDWICCKAGIVRKYWFSKVWTIFGKR